MTGPLRAATSLAGVVLLAACAAPSASPPTAASSPTASASAAPQLGACAPEYLTTVVAGQLNVGIESSVREPFFNGADPGKAEGYEIALVEALADTLGVKRTAIMWDPMTVTPSAGVPGDVDFVIGQMPVSTAVDDVVEYSEPYLTPAAVVVVPADSGLAAATSASALLGTRLGAVRGDFPRAALTALTGAGGKVVGFATPDTAAAGIAAGRVDAIVVDQFSADRLIAADPSLVAVGTLPELPVRGYGLAFAAGNPLVGCVNEALLAMAWDGTTAALAGAWLEGRDGLAELR